MSYAFAASSYACVHSFFEVFSFSSPHLVRPTNSINPIDLAYPIQAQLTELGPLGRITAFRNTYK